jgi:hypothetical protein
MGVDSKKPDIPGEFVKPAVEMVGTDGNVFSIIGRVSKVLKQAGHSDKAKEWQEKATSQQSYDAVLQLMFKYVDPY